MLNGRLNVLDESDLEELRDFIEIDKQEQMMLLVGGISDHYMVGVLAKAVLKLSRELEALRLSGGELS
jgi:hypothetical protein